MDTLPGRISPKEAGEIGAQYFREMMEGQPTPRLLLEGLEYIERQKRWVVTLGFDSERSVPVSGLERLMPEAPLERREVIREFRSVHISARDGSFIKMERA